MGDVYDGLGRLEHISYSKGVEMVYAYDMDRNLSCMETRAGNVAVLFVSGTGPRRRDSRAMPWQGMMHWIFSAGTTSGGSFWMGGATANYSKKNKKGHEN